MNCPWSEWLATTMYFCEADLCAWIKQPGNAWSSFFHLAVGLYLWFRWRKTRPAMGVQLLVTMAAIALGSFLLHASMTFAGEVADLAGMYLLTSFVVLWNAERYQRARFTRFWRYFAGLILAPVVAILLFGSVGVLLFKALIAVALGIELVLWKRGDKAPYRYLLLNGLIFFVAYKLWWLDVDKVWCDPHNHVYSGHVFWHLLTALAVVPLAKFYEPFRR